MNEILQALLIYGAPTTSFVVGVLIVYKAAQWGFRVEAIDKTVNKAEMKLELLERNVGAMDNKVESVEKASVQMSRKLDTMNTSVIGMGTKVDLLFDRFAKNTTETNSPKVLSEFGKSLRQSIKADEILDRYWETIYDIFLAESPETPYDIQILADKIASEKLISMLSKEDQRILKDAAFREGVLLFVVTGMFGVMIRDRVLAIRGIDVSELDKHAHEHS